MSTESLPERPTLEHLKGEAKDLERAVVSGDVDARVELAMALGREPDLVEGCGDPGDEFLRLACLTYGGEDGPERWRAAAALLAKDPTLPGRGVHVAAVAGDVAEVGRFLTRDRSLAVAEGGPFGWVPLLYLAYARTEAGAAPDVARLLLEAGADPNAGYLWHGEYLFTALTGVLGEGELGPVRQPPHPAATELAVILLDAGADPNDSQALYNRMFEPGNDHLELLFRYGLGRGDGGPWRRAGLTEPPADLVSTQLHWAVTHGMEARVRLLIEHGVDVTSPFEDGSTTSTVALLNGDAQIAELVMAAGCPAPQLGPVEAFVVAAMAGDRATADGLVADHPALLDEVRAARPGLVTWAAARGRTATVRLLVELGFDVNAMGRGDAPVDEPWETALHHAAARGDLPLAELLLELGADPNIRDARFESPPLGWARHSGQDHLVALLAPLTGEAP